ncbi:hypothetical protein GN244_ATG00175 [Phytophthora infestans]|uniref:Uncharacterized protein n=1 Tax=Phytophthora infestans TaxID=4787 RepID=A0A833T4G9_PHYIN|nr:hypothetical protein GN244_ATG00175 [Phytophthora infestans]
MLSNACSSSGLIRGQESLWIAVPSAHSRAVAPAGSSSNARRSAPSLRAETTLCSLSNAAQLTPAPSSWYRASACARQSDRRHIGFPTSVFDHAVDAAHLSVEPLDLDFQSHHDVIGPVICQRLLRFRHLRDRFLCVALRVKSSASQRPQPVRNNLEAQHAKVHSAEKEAQLQLDEALGTKNAVTEQNKLLHSPPVQHSLELQSF